MEKIMIAIACVWYSSTVLPTAALASGGKLGGISRKGKKHKKVMNGNFKEKKLRPQCQAALFFVKHFI